MLWIDYNLDLRGQGRILLGSDIYAETQRVKRSVVGLRTLERPVCPEGSEYQIQESLGEKLWSRIFQSF